MSRIGKNRIDGLPGWADIPAHFFFLEKRKLSPYRACGVVGQSPTVLKEKRGVPYVVQIHGGAEY